MNLRRKFVGFSDLPENPVDMEDRIIEIVVTLCTLWCLYKIMMCFYLKDSLCIDPKIRHKTVFEMLLRGLWTSSMLLVF